MASLKGKEKLGKGARGDRLKVKCMKQWSTWAMKKAKMGLEFGLPAVVSSSVAGSIIRIMILLHCCLKLSHLLS
ncbi:hypothetical protein AAC387_Pa01g0101 [Persea americana]